MIPNSAHSILGLNDHPTAEQSELPLCRVLNDDDPMNALNVSDSSNLISLDLRTPPQSPKTTQLSSLPANNISENRSLPEQIEPHCSNTSPHEFDPLDDSASDELLAGIGRSRSKQQIALGKNKTVHLKSQGAHYTISGLFQQGSSLSMFELVKLAQIGRLNPLDIVCHEQGRSERAINIPALREHFLARRSKFSSRLRSSLFYLSFLTCCSVFVWYYFSGGLTVVL